MCAIFQQYSTSTLLFQSVQKPQFQVHYSDTDNNAMRSNTVYTLSLFPSPSLRLSWQDLQGSRFCLAGIVKIRFKMFILHNAKCCMEWSFKQSLNISLWLPGPGCSKLTASLVNDSLKFQKSVSNICQYLLLKKCEKLLQASIIFFNKKCLCIWL